MLKTSDIQQLTNLKTILSLQIKDKLQKEMPAKSLDLKDPLASISAIEL